jgi:hypothetical protein
MRRSPSVGATYGSGTFLQRADRGQRALYRDRATARFRNAPAATRCGRCTGTSAADAEVSVSTLRRARAAAESTTACSPFSLTSTSPPARPWRPASIFPPFRSTAPVKKLPHAPARGGGLKKYARSKGAPYSSASRPILFTIRDREDHLCTASQTAGAPHASLRSLHLRRRSDIARRDAVHCGPLGELAARIRCVARRCFFSTPAPRGAPPQRGISTHPCDDDFSRRCDADERRCGRAGASVSWRGLRWKW